MTRHNAFINSPIESILLEGASVVSSIASGIEGHPLNDYLMKSLFLQMTGFQEQKFKCIVWEVACEDYEFRRFFLNDLAKEGFSTIKSKNIVYNQLMQLLGENELSDGERKEIVDLAKEKVGSIFKSTSFEYWNDKDFKEFNSNI